MDTAKNNEPDIINPCDGLPPKKFTFYSTISEGENVTTEKIVLLQEYGMDFVEMHFRNIVIDLRPKEVTSILKAFIDLDHSYLLERRIAAIEKSFDASSPKTSMFSKLKKWFKRNF